MDRAVVEYACGLVGRMAVLSAGLDVDRQPLNQHVYLDRDGHRRRLRSRLSSRKSFLHPSAT